MPMRLLSLVSLATGLCLAAVPAAASAIALPELSARAGLWSHARDFQPGGVQPVASIGLRTRQPLSDHMDLKVDGWLDTRRDTPADGELREAWVGATTGPLELKIGRQVIVWGRADRLNPTDVFSTRDYTRLTADDEDQRLGVLTALARLSVGRVEVTALWLPEFRPNIFPFADDPPAVTLLPQERPADAGQAAARIDLAGRGVDFGLMWFDGIDRMRDLVPAPLPPGAPPGALGAIAERFPDVRVIGGDFAAGLGRVGLRGEVALTKVKEEPSPFVRNSQVWMVLGVERTFDSGWNLNLQGNIRWVLDWESPAAIRQPFARAVATRSAAVTQQLHPVQHGLSFRAARGVWNDRLRIELVTLGTFQTRDIAIRPKLRWSINDQLRLEAGADLFFGPDESLFGSVRTISGAWMQVARGF